jgi:NADH dehydrogenase
MPLIGNGKARVQPVYDADVGRAVVAVLERPRTTSSVFELGGPRIYTYREIAELTLREIARSKSIVSVPAGLLKLAAFFAEFLPTPPITRDQVDLMTHDNVVRQGAQTFATLDIEPTAVEPILPTYLDRYRHGGRYNQHAPA